MVAAGRRVFGAAVPGVSKSETSAVDGRISEIFFDEYAAAHFRRWDRNRFFANILALEGHDVVGIDLTEHMIAEAKRKAELYDVPSVFYVMDAERPDFPDDSFDVVISRNLTWALPHLGQAYKAWRRVLKDGGLLLNFDADYCHETTDMPLPASHAHQK